MTKNRTEGDRRRRKNCPKDFRQEIKKIRWRKNNINYKIVRVVVVLHTHFFSVFDTMRIINDDDVHSMHHQVIIIRQKSSQGNDKTFSFQHNCN